jgi:hypothetical protein
VPRIELPDGNYADLRELGDLRRADVRAALKSADDGSINLMEQKFGLDSIAAIQDGLLVRFIRSWSLVNGDGASPLPVTLESVQELPLRYYQPLGAFVAPVLQEVMANGEAPVSPLSEAR